MTEPECSIDKVGTKRWWANGKLHRLDGPAIEWASGTKHWFINGNHHRLDGPACEYADGTKEWWVNGKLHRLDGPAIEYADGTKEWCVDGKYWAEQDFPKAVIMFLLGCEEQASELIIGALNDKT